MNLGIAHPHDSLECNSLSCTDSAQSTLTHERAQALSIHLQNSTECVGLQQHPRCSRQLVALLLQHQPVHLGKKILLAQHADAPLGSAALLGGAGLVADLGVRARGAAGHKRLS